MKSSEVKNTLHRSVQRDVNILTAVESAEASEIRCFSFLRLSGLVKGILRSKRTFYYLTERQEFARQVKSWRTVYYLIGVC